MSKTQFPIWRTLRIGRKGQKRLLAELKAKGCKISDWVAERRKKPVVFPTSSKAYEIALVLVTAKQLGAPEDGTSEVWKLAKEHGLKLCSAVVAPYLCLALAEEKGPDSYDVYWIAMKAARNRVDYPSMFGVGVGGNLAAPVLVIKPGEGLDDESHSAYAEFIFVAPGV